MTASARDRERPACWPTSDVELIVESLRRGRVQNWFVLRPHCELAAKHRSWGGALARGSRIVIEARTLEPVGVLEADVPPPTRAPAGFNPYFDVPPS